MYRKILLTLDGSLLARAAIPHAAELARGTDCEVVVLQVIDSLEATRLVVLPVSYEAGRPAEELAAERHALDQQAAHSEVERAVRGLKASGVSNARGVVLEGLAGNVILDVVVAEEPGVVVMATRGRSGLGREVAGSVAEYVLRHAESAAVLLAGPRSGPGTTAARTT